MQAPINQEALVEKWAPLLDYDGLDPIKDNHRRMVTAVLLENQEQTQREEREFLSEQPTVTTGSSGATAGFSDKNSRSSRIVCSWFSKRTAVTILL